MSDWFNLSLPSAHLVLEMQFYNCAHLIPQGEGDKQDEQSETDAFAMFMLSFLVELTGVKDKAVRFRATQIISGILNGMSPESALEYVSLFDIKT